MTSAFCKIVQIVDISLTQNRKSYNCPRQVEIYCIWLCRGFVSLAKLELYFLQPLSLKSSEIGFIIWKNWARCEERSELFTCSECQGKTFIFLSRSHVIAGWSPWQWHHQFAAPVPMDFPSSSAFLSRGLGNSTVLWCRVWHGSEIDKCLEVGFPESKISN